MIDMERFLENKVCIITGAAQGIGKSIAERFASDGALVYACDRAEGVMDEWAKACSEKYGTRVCPLYFDVTDAVAVKSAFIQCWTMRSLLLIRLRKLQAMWRLHVRT